ncbi:endolytic transglycosylase MltG [Alteromonas sp. H39]|uniref:endolytic transglycosylase MltG n=1 Tax=Alteromonas sp. H39 TaxID=3389876 RepID=UPI0039E12DC2
MRLLISFVFLVLLAIGVVLGGVFFVNNEAKRPLEISSPTLVSVTPGQAGSQVVSELKANGYTQIHPVVIKIWLKFFAPASGPKAGTYQLTPGMSLQQAYQHFVQGEEYQFDVSLIEGLTFRQWLEILRSHDFIDFDVDDTQIAQMLSEWPTAEFGEARSPEGIFLADTYHFTANTSASVILHRAMLAMTDYLRSAWAARAVDLPISSPYEALILASIIEKETGVASERPKIAGVFVNRLNSKMRLQTDPTVIYGIGENFDGNITRAHLKQKTPYNTYVIHGLPPTPIAMAGKPAIDAALQPLQTDALYFVSRGDGTHQFSTNLEDHNSAVYQYQIKKQD